MTSGKPRRGWDLLAAEAIATGAVNMQELFVPTGIELSAPGTAQLHTYAEWRWNSRWRPAEEV